MFPRSLLIFFSFSLFLVCLACNKTNDTTITTDIQAKMFAEPQLKSASVDVSAKDGMVTLSGQGPMRRLGSLRETSPRKRPR